MGVLALYLVVPLDGDLAPVIAVAALVGMLGWLVPLTLLEARRIAVVDDVIGPMLFLLGPGARFMTGQTLYINGGRLMVP